MAWTLHPDFRIASAIALEAIQGLPTTYAAQQRREEYSLRVNKTRTRITMAPAHLLQRYVLAASEPYERQREAAQQVSHLDLTLYYIKECVRFALKCNSFHVAVAIGRILHAYGTTDVLNMYSDLAPDRAKMHDQCRAWKKRFLDYLDDRFRPFLQSATEPGRQRHFVTAPLTPDLIAFAQSSLRSLIPFGTPHLNQHCDLEGNVSPTDDNLVEIQRVHAWVCPACFARQADKQGLPAPAGMLSLPVFRIPSGPPDGHGDKRFNPPPLTETDLRHATEAYEQERARRARHSPATLRIFIDGVDRGPLDSITGEPIVLSENNEVVDVMCSTTNQLVVRHVIALSDDYDFEAAYAVGASRLVFETARQCNTFVLRILHQRTSQSGGDQSLPVYIVTGDSASTTASIAQLFRLHATEQIVRSHVIDCSTRLLDAGLVMCLRHISASGNFVRTNPVTSEAETAAVDVCRKVKKDVVTGNSDRMTGNRVVLDTAVEYRWLEDNVVVFNIPRPMITCSRPTSRLLMCTGSDAYREHPVDQMGEPEVHPDVSRLATVTMTSITPIFLSDPAYAVHAFERFSYGLSQEALTSKEQSHRIASFIREGYLLRFAVLRSLATAARKENWIYVSSQRKQTRRFTVKSNDLQAVRGEHWTGSIHQCQKWRVDVEPRVFLLNASDTLCFENVGISLETYQRIGCEEGTAMLLTTTPVLNADPIAAN